MAKYCPLCLTEYADYIAKCLPCNYPTQSEKPTRSGGEAPKAPSVRAFSTASSFQFKTNLVRPVKILLLAQILLLVAAMWSGWLEIELLEKVKQGVRISDQEAKTNDMRQGAIGLLQLGLAIILAIIFLRWKMQANRNARALKSEGMEFQPGWCAGWYFVPVYGLFKPYQAMKEIWKASDPEKGTSDWKHANESWLINVWWLLWIVSAILSQASSTKIFSAETIDELYVSSWLMLISDAADIPLALTAIVLVTKLHERQLAKYKAVYSNHHDEQQAPA